MTVTHLEALVRADQGRNRRVGPEGVVAQPLEERRLGQVAHLWKRVRRRTSSGLKWLEALQQEAPVVWVEGIESAESAA